MENIFIEYDEEAKYLAEHVQCSFEDAQKYVDAEYDYLDGKGLIAHSEEEFNERPFSNVIIEPEQMCSFISDITGLNPELCNCLDSASFMFLVDKGMISRNKEVDEEYECCKHDCVYNSKGL